MSLSLPLSSSPLRECFDLADLVPLGMPGGKLKAPTFTQARIGARDFLAGSSAKSVNSICLRADGSLVLARFSRNASKVLWKFCD